MSDEIIIDGEQFISSKRASQLSGYEQDYIGQLCRGGNIKARRVGGLWYISSDSLKGYMDRAEAYKPVPPANNAYRSDPDSLLSFDGKGYISAARAAKLTGYSPDYIGQMARAEIIPSRQVGNRWYVEQGGLLKHKESKDALLAAVQAESVGIRRDSEQNDALSRISYGGAGPFLKYTSDTRELLPDLDDNVGDNGIGAEREEFQIPIHVISDRRSVSPDVGSRHSNLAAYDTDARIGRSSEKTMYSLVLPAMMMTIVIVISLGFVSLKNSSVYTDDRPVDGGGRMLAASAAAGALVEEVADALEILLAPELVYIREK